MRSRLIQSISLGALLMTVPTLVVPVERWHHHCCHHDEESCTICVVSHAPAAVEQTVIELPIAQPGERLVAVHSAPRASSPLREAHARAPPSA